MGAAFGLVAHAEAQTYTNVYWNPTGLAVSLGGTGTWNSGNLYWSLNASGGPTLAVPNNYYIYNFSGTSGTVSESSSFTVAGINWLTSGYTWTSSANRTLTGFDTLSTGTNAIYIANNANVTVTGSGFTFDALSMTGGTGATFTLNNAAGAVTTNIFGTTSAKGGRTNYVNTVITGAGTIVLGTQAATTGFTQAGNITNNTSGMLLLTNSASGNATFTGSISGSGAVTLVSSGSGNIVLGAANSYAGGTTVNGTGTGQIELGTSSSLSSAAVTIAGAGNNYIRAAADNLNIANTFVINSGSTLRLATTNSGWKSTWSGTISGAGGIYYAYGDGGLYLTANNSSFAGGINNGSTGTLFVSSLGMAGLNSSIGTGGTITLSSDSGTSGAGTIQWLGTANEISDKTFALSAVSSSTSQGVKIYAGASAQGGTNVTLTLNGNISSTSTNNKVITLGAFNTNTLVVNGAIDQTAGYVNSVAIGNTGTGTVVLGNSGNSFSGGVSISAGASSANTVQVSLIGNSGANSPLGTAGTINIGGSSSSGTNILKYTGSGETSDKVINLAGTTGGATLDQSGTGNLKFTSALTATGVGAKTLALQGATDGTGELAANINDLGGNVISLAKSGSGTWTLSGNNSYSGNTAISGGALVLSGANSGSGTVSLSSSSSVLRLLQTGALPNGTLLGASSSTNTGTVDLGIGGNFSIASFGSKNSGAGYMNFTNSSGSAATLTFTAVTNYVTSGSAGGRTVANNSTNLSLIFSGAVDIGSTSSNDVTFTGAGNTVINGAVVNTNTGVRGLTKNGSGTLTLTAAGSYNGATTISGGTLQIGNGGTTGALGTNSVTDNASLIFNRSDSYTVANTISGSGSLTKSGNGTLTLSGPNTYSGGTLIGAGALQGDSTSLQGAITNNASLIFNASTNGTYGGVVSGSGGLTKSGAGVIILSANNSYGGATTISAGTLQIGAGGTSGSIGSTSGVSNDGTLAYNRSDNLTAGYAISGAGNVTKSGAGTVILSADNTYAGATTISAGTLQVGAGGTSGSIGSTSGVSNDGTLAYNRSDNLTAAYAISGSGGLANSGAGTVTLSATNSYGGGTSIGAGAISVSADRNLGAVPGAATAGSITLSGGKLLATTGFTLSSNRGIALGSSGGTVEVASGQNLAYGGVAAGLGSLTKSGNGTLTMSGPNTYSGGTVVGAGALRGDTTSLQGAITNNASLIFDQSSGGTYSGVLSGSGSLVKEGSGALRLSSSNSYSGGTLLNAGGLEFTSDYALGSGTLTIGDGTTLASEGSRRTIGNGLIVAGNFTLGNGSAATTFTGNIDLGASTRAISVINSATINTGVISNGGLALNDVSGLTNKHNINLGGANTFAGGVALGDYINLRLDHVSAAGSGTITQSNSTSQVQINVAGTVANSMSLYNVAFLQSAQLSGALTLRGTVFDMASGITATNSGTISGTGGLSKTGAGTLVLSGTDTYSGATTVSGGKLVVSGSANSSTFTVQSGGTLGGAGSIGGLILNSGGTVSPGNSPGTLSVVGGATWNAGGNYNWQVYNAAGTAGSTNGWDLITLTGTLDLSALSIGNEFNINLWSLSGISSDTNGAAINFDPAISYSWKILTADGGISGFSASGFNLNASAINGTSGFQNDLAGGAFSVAVVGKDLNLVFTSATPVPEPGTWATAAMLAVGAAFLRSRRRKGGA